MKMYIFVAAIFLITATGAIMADTVKTEKLYTFDLTYTLKLDRDNPEECRKIWDDTHFVTSLQGIVNRNNPRLYVYLCGGENAKSDRYWLEEIRKTGKYLNNFRLIPVPDIPTLIKTFRRNIKGLVVYDENVASTSNVASTVAGVENLVCVRYDKSKNSLYTWLTTDPKGPKIPVKVWLINKDGASLFTGKGTIPGTNTKSTGSSKCDAYIWAKEKYLDTGLCNPTKLGYYIDAYWLKRPEGYIPNHTISNHDYIIAKKGFVFDLSPWDNDLPVDDTNQPMGTDFNTLCAILKSACTQTNGKKMIHAAGFVPWDKKYTNYGQAGGKHKPVPSEWRYAEILSCYNAYMDADAIGLCAMANASIFCKYPLEKTYPQTLPTVDDLKKKGYILPDGSVAPKSFVTIYVGDYDSAAWLYNSMPDLWNDPARGSIPLGWAFNPNLAERFAPFFDIARKTKTANDYFVAGDSGAGYVNPGYLVEPRRWSGLPSGLETWTKHCIEWFDRFDISLTGFVIDGYAPEMTDEVKDAYAKFSHRGFFGQKIPREGMHKNMPFLRMESDLSNPEDSAKIITSRAYKSVPEFFAYRNILWSPANQKKMMDLVKSSEKGEHIEFVDPYTLTLLIKQFYTTNQQKAGVNVDLWDYKSGSEITGNSPIADVFDPRDMFGGSFGTSEPDLVIFNDNKEPFTHWIEWKTPAPVELSDFKLYANGDNQANGIREFKEFRLFAKMDINDNWEEIDSYTPVHPYTYEAQPARLLYSKKLDSAVKGQYFRAEFDQHDVEGSEGMGPRIVELDGYGKKLTD